MEGEWSREATEIDSTRKQEITAPDQKKILVIDKINMDVLVNGKRLRGLENEGVLQPAEVLWAADSDAFFVTWSDGGLVGTWDVKIFVIRDGFVHSRNVSKEAIRRFKKEYKCLDSEEPNIGAVTWIKGSKQLLLMAEVPPHSSCPEMGKVRGYIVETETGRIVQELDRSGIKAKWGRYLGQRLRH